MSSLLERMKALQALKKPEEKKEEKKEEKQEEKKELPTSKVSSLISSANEKAIASSEQQEQAEQKEQKETINASEVKRIIENVSALEASDEMKELEGFNWQNFQDSLLYINEKQETSFPEINTALTNINKNLRAYPELAHLLSHEQIAVIVQRVLIQKNLWIAPQKKTSSSSGSKKKTSSLKITADSIAALVNGGSNGGELDADDL